MVLSNDDGIDAAGIEALHALCQHAGDCLIVAPAGPQSGVGHAVTTDESLSVVTAGKLRCSVTGTPADCARIALGRRADFARGHLESATGSRPVEDSIWLLSGINHGANLGVDTYISGTAAAAREAAILGFPAIALSQYVGRHRTPNWDCTVERASRVFADLIERRPRPGHYWNVNLPDPADDSVDCEIVHCPVDPSPHAIDYLHRSSDGGTQLTWNVDYHNRPRLPDHDIDVCFSGRIAVSEVPL